MTVQRYFDRYIEAGIAYWVSDEITHQLSKYADYADIAQDRLVTFLKKGDEPCAVFPLVVLRVGKLQPAMVTTFDVIGSFCKICNRKA